MTTREVIDKIVDCALNKRAQDIKILDLTKVTSITDYFVICTADSKPQVKAICQEIEEQLLNENIRVWHIEGLTNLHWVLMDYVDLVVHIFLPEVRDFYSLERLWGDAEIIEIDENDNISELLMKNSF